MSQAAVLTARAVAYSDMLDGDNAIAQLAMHNPNLVQGISASLRTLIIASFRAPATQFVVSLLKRLNPTTRLLRSAGAFCCHHEYIFTLLCLLNVNMGALELSRVELQEQDGNMDGMLEAYHAHELLHELAVVYSQMSAESQTRVYKRVVSSCALPISRDTPSYVAVMSVLHGGAAGQLEYVAALGADAIDGGFGETLGRLEEDVNVWDSRAEAKRAAAERMAAYRQAKLEGGFVDDNDEADSNYRDFKQDSIAESKTPAAAAEPSAFEIAVSIANAAETRIQEAKEAKADAKLGGGGESKSSGFRLLGQLPALGPRSNREDVKIALSLELPSDQTKIQHKLMVCIYYMYILCMYVCMYFVCMHRFIASNIIHHYLSVDLSACFPVYLSVFLFPAKLRRS